MNKVIGNLGRGVVAGAVGTVAMDLIWYRRYRKDDGDGGPIDWEFSSRSAEGWDDVGAPAKVGRFLARKVAGKEIAARRAGLTNDVVHWATGAQWGAAYGLAAGALGRSNPALGLLVGPVAWGTAYVVLPALDIYDPIWEYDTETLAKDLSAHLVFGLATAATYRLMRPTSA